MNLFDGAAQLRKQIGDRYGLNKREEIIRLAYEIARREDLAFEKVYRDALASLEDEAAPYRELKSALLKRRFPSLNPDEYSKVLFTRVPEKPTVSSPQSAVPGITKILIEKQARQFPLTEEIVRKFPGAKLETIESLKVLRRPMTEWIGSFGKDTLCLVSETHDFFKPCPCTTGALGCGYHVLNLGFGCPFDCSYCYLQFYQNTPAILLDVNPERFKAELNTVLKKTQGNWLRIGTGEFTDSLALDSITEYSRLLVPFFKDKNAFFELKTKADTVDHLAELDHGARTVIAWSLNPKEYESEERGAAPVAKRLEAAKKMQKAGYPVAFHFDPIFCDEGWEARYSQLVSELYDTLLERPRWISLGTFRFHRNLKKIAETRHPETRIFLGEQIEEAGDGKIRYPQRLRVEVYKKMLAWIRKRDPKTLVYLCMEPLEVWEEVMPVSCRVNTRDLDPSSPTAPRDDIHLDFRG